MQAVDFLVLQFFFGLCPHLRIVGFIVFEQVPEDARQVDSLAAARSPFGPSPSANSFRGSSAQVCAIAPIGFHPVARPARHPRGTDDDALVSQRANETHQRKAARPGLVTELQGRVGMGGLELFDQSLHVLMRATDNAPTAHLGAVRGRDGNGDGVIVDIQADVLDKVHVSAFLSVLSFTDQHCGSALRLTPARHPRSGRADTLAFTIASHSD